MHLIPHLFAIFHLKKKKEFETIYSNVSCNLTQTQNQKRNFERKEAPHTIVLYVLPFGRTHAVWEGGGDC